MNSFVQSDWSTSAVAWIGRTLLLLALMAGVVGTGVAQAQDTPADATATVEDGESADASAAESDDATEKSSPSTTTTLLLVVAIFVLPILIGNWLAKSFRMPEYSWKFAVALGTVAAAGLVVWLGNIKYGPDLSGGMTLIYELQDTSVDPDEMGEELSGQTPADRSATAKKAKVKQLIAALTERVDPSGTKEVTIREYGAGQIEIIIPSVGPQEQELIERRIYTAGALEFRLTASPAFSQNRAIIDLALALPPGENEVRMGGEKVAEWVSYKVEEFGPVEQPDNRLVKRMAGQIPQALILTNDNLDVTGEYLRSSSAGVDQMGRPQVRFTINQRGAYLMGRLTGKHLPNASGQEYYLGVILDKKLLSAPSIQGKITTQGEITGSMGKEEVDFIVGVLNSGSLPAQLNKEPLSREQISPTLGQETVDKATIAITYSIVAVMVFMLLYYRFSGVVACLTLGANLLLILGFMMQFNVAFTLPGLAGLVLTIGMSVDANVLIFERIREERKRGAALRMAIRNGFGRATRTIIDANLTTLITAAVIYKIAPDNVKGFGVTLFIGIVMSVYAAIFLSRIIFDVAEKLGSIKELGMGQIIGQTNFNFLGKRAVAAVLSVALIGIGLSSVFTRGTDLLNIDFTGGSSVTMVFKDGQELDFSEVKQQITEKTDLDEKNLSLVEVGGDKSGKQYKVSSVEQDVQEVQRVLHETFGERLKTYQVEASAVSPLDTQTGAIKRTNKNFVSLVSFQVEETESETDTEESIETESEESTTEADETDESAAEETSPAESSAADPFAGGSTFTLNFEAGGDDAGLNFETVRQMVQDGLDAIDHSGAAVSVTNPLYQIGSARRFNEWEVKVALPAEEAQKVVEHLKSTASSKPIFPLANKIGGRIAGDMKTKAIAAIVISLLGIVAYIWFRFQHVMYGLAAVVALIHDVLITLGMIAMSAWLVGNIPGLANGLLIEKFQISLPIVAAFLTIIGYSLNDTIVVFDRIREVKGKSPNLSADMINTSINQTLARTLLTSLTTFLSVILLYAFGGDGIHGFAFALVVGVIVGTYSSIFIASPSLLWMSQRAEQSNNQNPPAKAA